MINNDIEYDKAKEIVNKAPCKTYTYHNHPYQKGYIRCCGGDGKEYFLVSDIEQALLQYRRENNIFEVGDEVVSTLDGEEDWKNAVCRILGFHKNMAITTGFSCYIHHYEYRHATDEEIQAGRRL